MTSALERTPEVKWGEDNSIDHAPTLSEEEKHAVKERCIALDKLLREQGKAKYKIEVMFSKRRSMHAPCPGIVHFFESGTQFHGGGDTKIYLCPGKMLGKSDCEAVIPFSSNGYGYLLCPECKTVWQGPQVIGEIGYNLPLRKWAEVLLKHFVRFGHNADFYVKFSKHDIRAAALMEQQRQMHGDKLNITRTDRPRLVYPLRNLLRDCSAGADLLGRIYAFLTA